MPTQRYDVQRPDGTWAVRHWGPRNTPVFAGDGEVRFILHEVEDVTEQVTERESELDARLQAERRLRESEEARTEIDVARQRSDAVLASIADAFYLLDREWRFIYVNDAAEPLLQTTRAALLGRTLWGAFPDVAGSPLEGPYREAMAGGRPTSAEAYFSPLGTWFDVRTDPCGGGLMVHFREVVAPRGLGRVCAGSGGEGPVAGRPRGAAGFGARDKPRASSRAGTGHDSTTRRPMAPFWPWPKPWFTNGNSPGASQTSSKHMPPPAGTPNVCTPRSGAPGGAPG